MPRDRDYGEFCRIFYSARKIEGIFEFPHYSPELPSVIQVHQTLAKTRTEKDKNVANDFECLGDLKELNGFQIPVAGKSCSTDY